MFCKCCSQDKVEKDFLNDSDTCYKCVYREKQRKLSLQCVVITCRICHKDCGGHRWVYCSDKCSKEGHQIRNKNYWAWKIRTL